MSEKAYNVVYLRELFVGTEEYLSDLLNTSEMEDREIDVEYLLSYLETTLADVVAILDFDKETEELNGHISIVEHLVYITSLLYDVSLSYKIEKVFTNKFYDRILRFIFKEILVEKENQSALIARYYCYLCYLLIQTVNGGKDWFVQIIKKYLKNNTFFIGDVKFFLVFVSIYLYGVKDPSYVSSETKEMIEEVIDDEWAKRISKVFSSFNQEELLQSLRKFLFVFDACNGEHLMWITPKSDDFYAVSPKEMSYELIVKCWLSILGHYSYMFDESEESFAKNKLLNAIECLSDGRRKLFNFYISHISENGKNEIFDEYVKYIFGNSYSLDFKQTFLYRVLLSIVEDDYIADLPTYEDVDNKTIKQTVWEQIQNAQRSLKLKQIKKVKNVGSGKNEFPSGTLILSQTIKLDVDTIEFKYENFICDLIKHIIVKRISDLLYSKTKNNVFQFDKCIEGFLYSSSAITKLIIEGKHDYSSIVKLARIKDQEYLKDMPIAFEQNSLDISISSNKNAIKIVSLSDLEINKIIEEKYTIGSGVYRYESEGNTMSMSYEQLYNIVKRRYYFVEFSFALFFDKLETKNIYYFLDSTD